MAISVIISDEHQIMLEALSFTLNKHPEVNVIGTVSDASHLLRLDQPNADIAIIGINRPDNSKIEVARRLPFLPNGTKPIILSGHSEKQYVLRMLESGVKGFVMKDNSSDDLIRAIRTVANGQTYLCPEVTSLVLANQTNQPNSHIEKLGRRECDVLHLISDGLTSPEIAKRLFISPSTVDVHRRNIKRKLQLHSIADLTKYAVKHGFTACT